MQPCPFGQMPVSTGGVTRLRAVLILPPGHAEAMSNPRRLSRGERRSVGAVGAVALVLIVVAVFALTRSAAPPRRGCISVTVQSSLGGQIIAGCGATARELCAAVGTPGGYTGSAGALLAAQCRKQGLTVG